MGRRDGAIPISRPGVLLLTLPPGSLRFFGYSHPWASAEPPLPNFRVTFFEGRVDGAKAPRKNGLSRGWSHGQSTARVKNLPWPEGLKEQSLDYVKHVIYLILYMRGVIS